MNSPEQQVRTVVLAQALESADPQGELVSLAERRAATLAAMKSLQVQGSGPALADAQRVALRARHLLDVLALKQPALAALERPPAQGFWLAIVVPLLALLAGIGTDRIANPHRVDLLSLPLLMVIGFNLLMYGLLAVLALRQKSSANASRVPSLIPALLQRLATWRLRQRGTRASVLTAFYQLWNGLAGKLLVYRCKTVLHLSAAAWGAGIALSLAGRGLVVEYRVGWESTFLGTEQVYRLLEIIFWLPAKVFNLTPFTLQQVASLRDFGGSGVAGDRWVWMYVGLLALVVVLPRLLLAAWATWLALSISRGLALKLDSPYFQHLLASMRCTRLRIGLVFADERCRAPFLRMARGLADDPLAQRLAHSTPDGDLLQWAEEPAAGQPVDGVLFIADPAFAADVLPQAWEGQPLVTVAEHRLAAVWDPWPLLIRSLAAGLASQAQPGWDRLADTLAQRRQQRFDGCMAVLAVYLSKVAAQLGGEAPQQAMSEARDELFLSLQQLHRLDRATSRELEQKLMLRYAAPALIGKTTTTVASAATGATAGLALDAATGFLSLGAGAALGGLLGAGMGWATAAWRKKGAAADLMQTLTEAALLLWLELDHALHVPPASADQRATWPAHISFEVQQRQAGLQCLRSVKDGAAPGQADPQAVLVLAETAWAVLAKLYPPPTAVEILGHAPAF